MKVSGVILGIWPSKVHARAGISYPVINSAFTPTALLYARIKVSCVECERAVIMEVTWTQIGLLKRRGRCVIVFERRKNPTLLSVYTRLSLAACGWAAPD